MDPEEDRTITNLQKEIHKTAREKGFWDQERNIGELISLCHSELSEALEEARLDNALTGIRMQHKKPLGFPIELADLIIRVLDMAGGLGIDLGEAIRIKMAYNKTRERKHGKRF